MKELIFRNTPEIADAFALRDIESVDGKNTYEVFCEDGKIVICGDCKISQAMGYYEYLKKVCHVNYSHCGNTTLNVTEAPLFEGKLSKVIPQKKRAYLSYRAYGYSLAFWDWEKWEKEIDFMAMNGINMPLSVVGSEAVLYYTMRDFKYSQKGALSFISGPGFWPWQLTGNLDSYFSITDVKYIEARLELGKKIIQREVSLGMTPIQQGFAGMVPRSFSKLFKRIRIGLISSWRNFAVTYRIDPLDPVFKKFGTAYLEKQRELFGSFHYFACDPFFENKPNVRAKNYLWKVGRAVDTLYKDFDPESVWVMQSSTLFDQMVKSVPKGRLLILDNAPGKYKETEGFWGHDFIMGNVCSYGDRNSLHGDIKALADNAFAGVEYENCVGTGLFPEGIYQNPLYFDLAFEMMTAEGKIDLDAWLKDYARRRYGTENENLEKAVKFLKESCYGEGTDGVETGSIICARPSTVLPHTAPGDRLELTYSNAKLYEAAKALLSAGDIETDGYKYDVCDITRQVVSNLCRDFCEKAINGYNNKDVKDFERCSNSFLRACDEVDELLLTRPELTLHQHLKEASDRAFEEKDKENYELNVLTQLTVWGPIMASVNYDYAWKEWGGLIGTYYVKRWQSFFERLAFEFTHRKKFSSVTKKQIDGRNVYRGSNFYKGFADFEKKWLSTADPAAPTDGNTIEIARDLIEKYAKYFNPVQKTLDTE